jgi:hypothetical protein
MVLHLRSCKRFYVLCKSHTLVATCSCTDETAHLIRQLLHLSPSHVVKLMHDSAPSPPHFKVQIEDRTIADAKKRHQFIKPTSQF